jgi:ELWxxDGT repeat protein
MKYLTFTHLLAVFIAQTTFPAVAQEATARRVADLNPGSVGSFPSNFIAFAGSLCFSAYNFELGRELWRYDGASITLVSNINDNASDLGGGFMQGHDSVPDWFTLFNGALYFSAFDERRGGELWRYDGTRVVRVADVNPDPNDTIKILPKSSWPQELTVMNNALYFSADDGGGFAPFPNYELWRYDGVRAAMVTNIHPNFDTNYSSYPHELTAFNNALYFVADDGSRGYELWKCDGVRALLLADINPGTNGSVPKHLTVFNNAIYFRALDDLRGYELWKTDGTNTTLVVDLNPTGSSRPDFFTVFKNALYFGADDGTNGFELWKYNGAAVTRVADINPAGDSAVKNLTVFGDNLYFAADDGVHGWELWKCDGASVSLVADINPQDHSFPEQFTVWNNRLCFSASNALSGYEMWMYDGQAASLAVDIFPGPQSSFPFYPAGFGRELLFSANDGYFSDWELWAMTVRPLRITGIEQLGADIRLSWRTLGGTTNIVQTAGTLAGPFTNLSQPFYIPGSSETSTNYTDRRNINPSIPRFYRILQP